MDGLVYYPFHFVEKNNLEYARKNSKVLRVVRREGEFFTIPAVFALEGSKEKNCFKMEMIFLLFLYGTKSRESNGPNGHPAQCMISSEFYKNRYIQRYWPATNWILCLCFCCGSTVCHWWRFCLFAVNYILNSYRPRLIKLAKIWKPPLLLLRWRVRQGRCCVDLL